MAALHVEQDSPFIPLPGLALNRLPISVTGRMRDDNELHFTSRLVYHLMWYPGRHFYSFMPSQHVSPSSDLERRRARRHPLMDHTQLWGFD